MKRVPANRALIFLLIAGFGLFADLYSKSIVFEDLGYRDAASGVPIKPGGHQRFDHPQRLEGESRPYIDGWLKFRLLTSFNEGALWGIGQGWTVLFASLSVLAAIGVVVWLFVFGAAKSKWITASLALVTAGALGNLWDRIGMHGCANLNGETIYGVRDFLFFEFGDIHYPIFNLADSFLVTGAVMLFLRSCFAGTAEDASTSPKPADVPVANAEVKSGESTDIR